MNIKEYKIISHPHTYTSQMSWEVNIDISNGWQPYGTIFITPDYISQVMVKYQKEDN